MQEVVGSTPIFSTKGLKRDLFILKVNADQSVPPAGGKVVPPAGGIFSTKVSNETFLF
jgi:hypothetical protein